jgi:hypothetical protein
MEVKILFVFCRKSLGCAGDDKNKKIETDSPATIEAKATSFGRRYGQRPNAQS